MALCNACIIVSLDLLSKWSLSHKSEAGQRPTLNNMDCVLVAGEELEDLLFSEEILAIAIESITCYTACPATELVPAILTVIRSCVSLTEARSQAFALTMTQKRQNAGYDSSSYRRRWMLFASFRCSADLAFLTLRVVCPTRQKTALSPYRQASSGQS